ncbi:hypothetical protein Pst134EA_005366 [Puccinia striiformis f. sp. tritici]|uniref:hypothetical protein n=1 Tax=Puccinia striiformis f. sp. tritici TaxID=168172 RepID=UPI002008B38B|nr:hypothetical protein Pst134EA_005366 [Puccinia striiformis f. sp. tritici]KAH9462553.1 hypothetical protein Pst134EB_006443 [Puccinia striiformis f. sp. tritici]KAH9471467.1 hypothetical protein Pst134EA_005366 [Puccinia striiformis f. sp. tritici]KAI9619144.1 hypothetical protein H4Q26_011824 [Puccinia striiformis f. sp. tritici PST-130]
MGLGISSGRVYAMLPANLLRVSVYLDAAIFWNFTDVFRMSPMESRALIGPMKPVSDGGPFVLSPDRSRLEMLALILGSIVFLFLQGATQISVSRTVPSCGRCDLLKAEESNVQNRHNLAKRAEINEPMTCSICLYEMKGDVSEWPGCGHSFHRHCVDRWRFASPSTPTCPYCRRDDDDLPAGSPGIKPQWQANTPSAEGSVRIHPAVTHEPRTNRRCRHDIIEIATHCERCGQAIHPSRNQGLWMYTRTCNDCDTHSRLPPS